MAVRLSVIMVHTPPASAASSELAEAVVGQLIGLPEIDLMLVGPLSRLAEGSTDRLSLESIAGDVALLDWQNVEMSVADLEKLGFEGVRAPHDHDPNQPNLANATRRIYAFDLNKFSSGDSVCQAITSLKNRRQVRTFSLSLASDSPSPVSDATSRSATASASPPPTSPDSSAERPSSTEKPPAENSEVAKPVPGSGSSKAAIGDKSGGELDLDHLLDQLDELDP